MKLHDILAPHFVIPCRIAAVVHSEKMDPPRGVGPIGKPVRRDEVRDSGVVRARAEPEQPPVVEPITRDPPRVTAPREQKPELVPPGERRVRADAALPPAVLQAMRDKLGADFTRLPPAELARLTTAYNDFVRNDGSKRDVPAFLQTVGRALVLDRRRVVGDMSANAPEQLVRLAPALERQAGLMRVVESADFVQRLGGAAFREMRQRIFESRNSRAGLGFTPEDMREPSRYREFLRLYGEAVGPSELQRMAVLAGRQGRNQNVVADYLNAMAILHQPGGDGSTTLLRATPKQIGDAATAGLVALGREQPGLQAFSPEQVKQMAQGLRVPGTGHRFSLSGDPPRLSQEVTVRTGTGQPINLTSWPEGSASYDAYMALVRARSNEQSITRRDRAMPEMVASGGPMEHVSPLTVFREGAASTIAGLDAAATKLRDNTMTAGDLLPLAYQLQEHFVGQLFNEGNLRPGVVTAVTDLTSETRRAEEAAASERRMRTGAAVVGVVTGVGLLASGPLGWGVGVTSTLAVGATASAVATMGLDVNEYLDRLRAGGLNHAGLVLTNLQSESGAGLAASLALNVAGSLGNIGPVLAAQRLQYARGLVTAMRTEDGARTAAITGFLERNSVFSASEWQALSPERQATALRLVERFGSEVDKDGMRAILQFGARDAEVSNGAGAVANVDHMYFAYNEMNVAEIAARGRPLTERERLVNAIATIGTDAQGKFGHAALDIIPTLANGRTVSTSAEYLQAVREHAVRQAFAGLSQAQGADPRALALWRDRYLTQVAAEADPVKRNQALAKLNSDMQLDPQSGQWIQRQFSQTDYAIRMQGFVEGAFVHNVVDPGRIFTMGRAAGLDDAQAAEAAYRATMHGFGNAFVATAYPGMPQFARVMRPGTNVPLFSPEQLRHLDRVGRASLHYNQELQPTVAQAARWGIATDPPPRGVQQVYTAALRANGGRLPDGLQQWLIENGDVFRTARREAGIGAGATNADNLGNYVPEGMRKWAGIFAAKDFTPPNQRTIGHQVQRLLAGLNGYSIEEASVGNITRFDANFASSASRVGFARPRDSAVYDWFMQPNATGVFEVAPGASPSSVRAAADAVRSSFKQFTGSDADVLRAFYNQPQTGDFQMALAVIAEGNLPPAFNVQAALANARTDMRLSPLTQLLIYQQAVAQGVRPFDPR